MCVCVHVERTQSFLRARNTSESRKQGYKEGRQPPGLGERLCRGCENPSEVVAEQVMAEAAACSKTPSGEQRVPYYCWRTKWEAGGGGRNWGW